MVRARVSHPRRYSRHSVRLPCQLVRERGFQLIADRVVNLSERGVLVSPAAPALTGERLILSFQMPHSGEWVDAEATVVRVVHGRRRGEHTHGLALEFACADEIPRLILSRVVPRCPPVPPGRSRRRRTITALAPLVS